MYSDSLPAIMLFYDLDVLVRYFCVRDYLVAHRSLVSFPVFDRTKYLFIREFARRFSKRCSKVVGIPRIPIIWYAYRSLK